MAKVVILAVDTLVTLALGLLIIEYLLECFPLGIYSISRAQATCGLPARLECLHHVSASSIRQGCYGEAPRQLFHDDRRHPSHFHLPFKAVDECPERANRLCCQDAFLKKCFLALDKLAGSFCLFLSGREIS